MAPKPKPSEGLALPKFKGKTQAKPSNKKMPMGASRVIYAPKVAASQPGVAATMPKVQMLTFSTLARFFQKAYSSVLNRNTDDNKLKKADEEVKSLKKDLVAP
ncbi:hypothetical protein Patl1_27817 [Pistacia atlantica]|uniref:Uncharacterized protein n=1 Tax=Pistacia atlantica TaxID=434234 RepID=A0ACC1BCH6_9ROSI|nr:hypothetical protein Patl1_27817 [Pistacia atlantica]